MNTSRTIRKKKSNLFERGMESGVKDVGERMVRFFTFSSKLLEEKRAEFREVLYESRKCGADSETAPNHWFKLKKSRVKTTESSDVQKSLACCVYMGSLRSMI